jgi:hypothetical protein
MTRRHSPLITDSLLCVLTAGCAAALGFDHEHAACTTRQKRILDRKAEFRFLEYDWALNDAMR